MCSYSVYFFSHPNELLGTNVVFFYEFAALALASMTRSGQNSYAKDVRLNNFL